VALHHEVRLASKPAPTGKKRWRRGDALLEGLPPLARVGVTLELPAGCKQIRWYGRGPHETHSDRLLSGWLGVHETTASEPNPYVKPQEHGNRTGVRWVALTDETGAGLLVIGAPQIEFSAHHYAAGDMVIRHPHEVGAEVVLNLTRPGRSRHEACGPGVCRAVAQTTAAPCACALDSRRRPVRIRPVRIAPPRCGGAERRR
jgi:beta-galactosidase